MEATPNVEQADFVSGIAHEFAQKFPNLDPTAVELSYRLGAARAEMHAASERLFAQIGVGGTTSRFGVLRVLYFAADNRLTLNTIRDLMNVSPPSVTYLVDGLEKEGLVVRRRHRADRRTTWVNLTKEGKAVCETLVPALAQHMERLVVGFSMEEKETLNRLLARYQANAAATVRGSNSGDAIKPAD